jgi:ankyrin repeat protein
VGLVKLYAVYDGAAVDVGLATPVPENKPSTRRREPQTSKSQRRRQKINNDIRHAMGRTNLHKAAFDGNAERVKELLKKGANPNTKDKKGRTPLHWAASIRAMSRS